MSNANFVKATTIDGDSVILRQKALERLCDLFLNPINIVEASQLSPNRTNNIQSDKD